MDKPLRYSHHAETVMRERGLDPSWVEATVRRPDWSTGDRVTPGSNAVIAPLKLSKGGCCASFVLKRATKFG
jgi:hypothetical protein